MDKRIDVTKRKPRRLGGTPAHSFVNRASLITLGVGVAIGLLITFSVPLVDTLKSKYNFDLTQVSEKEQERRGLFRRNLSKPKTSEELLEVLELIEKQKSQ